MSHVEILRENFRKFQYLSGCGGLIVPWGIFSQAFKDVLSEQNWPNDKTDKCPQFFSALTIKLNPSKSQKYRIKISIEPTFSGHSIFEGFSESG